MELIDLLELYNNASDEVKDCVDKILITFQPRSEHQSEHSGKDQ